MRSGQLSLLVDAGNGPPGARGRANPTRVFSYNPNSNHVKIDKAVVGRIERGLSYGYSPFSFAYVHIEAASLAELLTKVKELHG